MRNIFLLLVTLTLLGNAVCAGGLDLEKAVGITAQTIFTKPTRQITAIEGESEFKALSRMYRIWQDPWLSEAGNRIAKEVGVPEVDFWVIDLLDEAGQPVDNAFQMPGLPPKVLVTSEMLAQAKERSELWKPEIAGVLAHEISHAYHEHVYKMLRDTNWVEGGVELLIELASPDKRTRRRLGAPGIIAKVAITAAFSRSAEQEADSTAVPALVASGYEPEYFAKMLEAYGQKYGKTPWLLGWASTHPDSFDRARWIRQKATKAREEYVPTYTLKPGPDDAKQVSENQKVNLPTGPWVIYPDGVEITGARISNGEDWVASQVLSIGKGCGLPVYARGLQYTLARKELKLEGIDPRTKGNTEGIPQANVLITAIIKSEYGTTTKEAGADIGRHSASGRKKVMQVTVEVTLLFTDVETQDVYQAVTVVTEDEVTSQASGRIRTLGNGLRISSSRSSSDLREGLLQAGIRKGLRNAFEIVVSGDLEKVAKDEKT